jgi:hypothetical protein
MKLVRRLHTIVLFGGIAFLGLVIAARGAQFWLETKKPTLWVVKALSHQGHGEDDGVLMCSNIEWVDWDFVRGRAEAAGIVLFGACTAFFAFAMVATPDKRPFPQKSGHR